jgi:hypothetical protein
VKTTETHLKTSNRDALTIPQQNNSKLLSHPIELHPRQWAAMTELKDPEVSEINVPLLHILDRRLA